MLGELRVKPLRVIRDPHIYAPAIVVEPVALATLLGVAGLVHLAIINESYALSAHGSSLRTDLKDSDLPFAIVGTARL